MTITLQQAVAATGITIHDYLDHTAEVPRIDRSAAQGDVSVLRVTTAPATTPMPAAVVLVRSEATTHTHTLHPSGPCFYDPSASSSATDLVLGTLTVPDGSTALLIHQEHAAIEILPGTYRIGRQREYAGEWSLVAD